MAYIPLFFLLILLLGSLGTYFYLKKKGKRQLDPEVASRGTSFILSATARDYGVWLIDPILQWCVRKKWTPTRLNILGMAFGGVAGFFFMAQMYSWGAFVLLISGLCDALDGRLARQLNCASNAGAFMDATMDRVGETLAFTGMILSSSNPVFQALVILSLGGSLLVSYTRAKGEAFGVPVKSGIMQRPERLALWIVATLTCPIIVSLTGWHSETWLSLAFLFMTLGVWLTTIYRILKVLDILSAPP